MEFERKFANQEIEDVVKSCIRGTKNKKYKIVAGVIKPDGVGGWYLLDDSDHTPINIDSVVSDTTKIRLTYSFTTKNNGIGAITCSPDEAMAGAGLIPGASVGKTYMDIYLGSWGVSAYFVWTGTAWSIMNNSGITGITYSNGVITITHRHSNGGGISAQCRNGVYLACPDATNQTTTAIKLFDYAGNQITDAAPNTNMRIFFNRSSSGYVPPSSYTDVGGNIWVYGMMEV